MKAIKIITSVLAAAVLALSVSGCQNTQSGEAQTTAENKKVIRVGVVGFDDNPLLENGCLALKNGYFKEELNAVGYEFELVAFPDGGPAINEAYASGQLDLAVYGDLPASVCFSKGGDIRVIGSSNSQINCAVIAGKDSGIESVKDLEGKKVIVGVGTIYHEYWQRLVEEYGIDESKVEIVNVVSDAATVFTSGEADAWITFYYKSLYYEAQGLGKTIENTVDHPEMATQSIVTGRKEYLDNNREAAEAFLKALKRSQEYAVQHPEELYKSVASQTIGVDYYRPCYGFDESFEYLSPKISSANREKLEYLNEFLANQGFIKEKIDLDSFIDESFFTE